MYRSDVNSEESERTAIRKAEKKYKIYYDNNNKKKKIARPVDLSEVVDFRAILEKYKYDGELVEGVSVLNCDFDQPIFCLESRPGFYFIPAALSSEEQCQWIRESLKSFPQPPNRTNHNAIYGPIEDLFVSAKEGKVLVLEDKLTDDVHWEIVDELDETNGKDACKSVSASVLLRKLRWSTLGLQFDWSKRCYNISLPHKEIPDALCQLAKKMAGPVMPCGIEFQPEAAIVNYFGLGDMLGGHLDDMEKDWSKPIVSMSLGCKAIFLLGGKSREDEPIAMFLRSGDVVLMAEEARECFHENRRKGLVHRHNQKDCRVSIDSTYHGCLPIDQVPSCDHQNHRIRRKIDEMNRELDKMLARIVEERVRTKNNNDNDLGEDKQEDLIDIILNIQNDESHELLLTCNNIKFLLH